MRHSFLFLGLLACACVPLFAWQVDETSSAPDENLKPVMRMKLDHSKDILEGLATENFDLISRNAQQLSLLSLESSWNVLVTEEYLKQGNSFRRSLETIHEAAKEKNIDRAALGYVDMTIRCVECHKYIRSQKAAAQQRALGN